jgi:hypothetical protein
MDHTFSPTAHGKGPADSIGFWVKHWLTTLTRERTCPFTTSLACAAALRKHIESTTIVAEDDDSIHKVHTRHVFHVAAEEIVETLCNIKPVKDTRRAHFYGGSNAYEI